MRLLLVEDDEMIGESVRQGLHTEGFIVDWVRDGRAADHALGTSVYDLMILDLGLPGMGGLQILSSLRARDNDIPVVIVTARDGVSDRVAGLNAGADDYLVKPFDLNELTARIRAVARRKSGRADAVIRFGRLTLDSVDRRVTVSGEGVSLSGGEFKLLEALMDRPGSVLSRAQLEDKLYGWGEEVSSNIVEVYIHALRKKLGSDVIQNVRGVGYTLSKE